MNPQGAEFFIGLKAHKDYLIGGYHDAASSAIEILNLFVPAEEELAEIDSAAAQFFINADYTDNLNSIIAKQFTQIKKIAGKLTLGKKYFVGRRRYEGTHS